MRRFVGMLVLVGALGFTVKPASACINCLSRPTIGNGGIPYTSYRKTIGGVDHICFKYVGRGDLCYPLAAFSPWGVYFH